MKSSSVLQCNNFYVSLCKINSKQPLISVQFYDSCMEKSIHMQIQRVVSSKLVFLLLLFSEQFASFITLQKQKAVFVLAIKHFHPDKADLPYLVLDNIPCKSRFSSRNIHVTDHRHSTLRFRNKTTIIKIVKKIIAVLLKK